MLDRYPFFYQHIIQFEGAADLYHFSGVIEQFQLT